MGATQFETQAIIRLIDEVSGPLRKLSGTIHAYNAEAARAAKNASGEAQQAFDRMGNAGKAMFGALTLAAGQFAEHVAAKMKESGDAIEKVHNDMRMFTTLTPEQSAALEKTAQTQGAWVQGGPTAYHAAQLEARKAGAQSLDAINMGAEYGSLYARMAHQDPTQGTRELIQHMMMMGELRDDMGKSITLQEATDAQLEHSLKLTLGRMATITKNVAGWTMEDTFNYFKNAGPTFQAEKVGWNQAAAMAAVMALKGFSGEVAGNAIASSYGRITSPKGPGRLAIAQAGLNWADYVQVNPEALTPYGFQEGIKATAGSFPKKTMDVATKLLDQYHDAMLTASGDASKQADLTKGLRENLTDALLASGYKNFDNRAKASNFVSKYIANAVNSVDMVALLADAKKNNLGIGFYNSIFGLDRGKQMMSITAEQLKTIQGMFEKLHPETKVDEITKEFNETYEKAQANMQGSLTGMYQSMFEPMKPALKFLMDTVSEAAQSITGSSEAVRGGLGVIVEGLSFASKSYREYIGPAIEMIVAWRLYKALGGKAALAAPEDAKAPVTEAPATPKPPAEPLAPAAPKTPETPTAPKPPETPPPVDVKVVETPAPPKAMEPPAPKPADAPIPKVPEVKVATPTVDIKAEGLKIPSVTDVAKGAFSGASWGGLGKSLGKGLLTGIAAEAGEYGIKKGFDYVMGVTPRQRQFMDNMENRGFIQGWKDAYHSIRYSLGYDKVDPLLKYVPAPQPEFNLDKYKQLGPVKADVTGTVSGSAEIVTHIEVNPSPLLQAIVTNAQNVTMPMTGRVGTVMGGSNGVHAAVGHQVE